MCCFVVCFYLSSFKWRICFVVLDLVRVYERMCVCKSEWENDLFFFVCVCVNSKYYLSRCHVQVLYVFLPLLLKHILFPIFLLPLLFFWTWSILVCYCCQCSARYSWAHCSLWYPTHSLLGSGTTHILHKIGNVLMNYRCISFIIVP